MSKPNKSRLKLETLRARAESKGDAVIEFDGVDGKAYTIPGPAFWDDAVHDAARAEDVPGMGRALLGDQYEAFVSGGHRSTDLMLVIEAYQAEQGATAGE
ncbi:hypothetical protein ACIQU6_07560 [Streptomyces sp. NPDC090442]|uniref:hypothetical protein n=1 Tax=Streptomyces sp. NPDC090442 TaxID=3365962 RepID=UPI0037F7B507